MATLNCTLLSPSTRPPPFTTSTPPCYPTTLQPPSFAASSPGQIPRDRDSCPLTNHSIQPHRDCPSHEIFDEDSLETTSYPSFPSISPSASFMGPLDATIRFTSNSRLNLPTRQHLLFVKLSTYLSTSEECKSQQKGLRTFHIAALFPLHDESFVKQHPLLEKADGALSKTNQILYGRGKFVGFLDKSLLQSYPNDSASIPVLIPEDFNFLPLGPPTLPSSSAPATPSKPLPKGAIVAGPVWKRPSPSKPLSSPQARALDVSSSPSGPAPASSSIRPTPIPGPSATGKSHLDLQPPTLPYG